MVSTLGLLLIAGLFLCLIAAIRSKSVVIIATFFVAVIGFFLWFAAARPVRVVSRPVVNRFEPIGIPAQTAQRSDTIRASTTWNSIDTDQFRTAIFPGAASAATDLARQVPLAITELTVGAAANAKDSTATASTESTGETQVVAEKKSAVRAKLPDTLPPKVRNAFRQELLNQWPKASFVTTSVAGQSDNPEQPEMQQNDVQLTLDLVSTSSEQAAWDSTERSEQGTLTCLIHTNQGSRSLSVDYIEKPWIEHADQFANSHSGRAFKVGVSASLCESPQAAGKSALASLNQIRLVAGSNHGQSISARVDESLIVDRFLQKLERPYGAVWREAVLVDLRSPAAEDLKAAAISTSLQKQRLVQKADRESWFQTLMLIAVFAITAIVGVVLNLVTEGYFRGRIVGLVIGFGVAAAAGVVITMA